MASAAESTERSRSGRVFHAMAAIPHLVKTMPNYAVFHHIIVHGSLKLERQSDRIKMNAAYEKAIEDRMEGDVGSGLQGVHAPNSVVHAFNHHVHEDAELLGMLDDLVSFAITTRRTQQQQQPQTTAQEDNHQGTTVQSPEAAVDENQQPTTLHPQEGVPQEDQTRVNCNDALVVVNSLLYEYMDQSCDLLGLDAHAAGVENDEYRLPNLLSCSAQDVLQWASNVYSWIESRYADYVSMEGINVMRRQFLTAEEKREFTKQICIQGVQMQSIIRDVLEDMQATLIQAEAALVMHSTVVQVFDSAIQLFVDCTNRLVTYYTPFIRINGIPYMQAIAARKSPYLALEGLDQPQEYLSSSLQQSNPSGGEAEADHPPSPPTAADVDDSYLHPLLTASMPANAKDVEEVFRFSSERLVCILKGEEMYPLTHPKVNISSQDMAACKSIFKGFSNVFFVHGFFKMLYSSRPEVMSFVCSKIAPMDKLGVEMLNRGMRNAAVAMVALKQGNRLIESFAGEVRASLQGSRDADHQGSYYECTCKAAFLDYVMWQLNCWTFGKSPYLAQKCAAKLLATAGLQKGQALLDLMKLRDIERSQARTRVCFDQSFIVHIET